MDALAHVDLQVLLHVGRAVEVEDAVDQVLRVAHLLDRLLLDVGRELLVAPVLVHPRVDEVLVDRRELGAEHVLQDLDDFVVPLHGNPLLASVGRAILTRLSRGRRDDRAGPAWSFSRFWPSSHTRRAISSNGMPEHSQRVIARPQRTGSTSAAELISSA